MEIRILSKHLRTINLVSTMITIRLRDTLLRTFPLLPRPQSSTIARLLLTSINATVPPVTLVTLATLVMAGSQTPESTEIVALLKWTTGRGMQFQYFPLLPSSCCVSSLPQFSRNSSNSGTGSRIGSWKRGGTRVSNFDVRPPDGVELPPIGVSSTSAGVPNSYFSYANNPAVSGAPLPGTGMAGVSKYGAPAPAAHQPQVGR
jgi:hypothetical protein